MHLTKHNIYVKDFKISSYEISKYAHFNLDGEAVAWRCSVKKVFLEISQNSQENTCSLGLQLY